MMKQISPAPILKNYGFHVIKFIPDIMRQELCLNVGIVVYELKNPEKMMTKFINAESINTLIRHSFLKSHYELLPFIVERIVKKINYIKDIDIKLKFLQITSDTYYDTRYFSVQESELEIEELLHDLYKNYIGYKFKQLSEHESPKWIKIAECKDNISSVLDNYFKDILQLIRDQEYQFKEDELGILNIKTQQNYFIKVNTFSFSNVLELLSIHYKHEKNKHLYDYVILGSTDYITEESIKEADKKPIYDLLKANELPYLNATEKESIITKLEPLVIT